MRYGYSLGRIPDKFADISRGQVPYGMEESDLSLQLVLRLIGAYTKLEKLPRIP